MKLNQNEIYELKSKYKMIFDYHTHTRYSHGILYAHGKGTIYENAKMAKKLGLEGIAISDHGPGHKFYGLDINKIPQMRKDILEAKKEISNLDIFLSVEANLIDTPNGLDISKENIKKFDFIIAGYHYGLPNGKMIPNKIQSFGIYPSGGITKLRNFNTEIALRALYENDIKILTHPGDKGPFDMEKLSKACEDTATYMEISSRHRHLTEDEIKIAMKYDIQFVISSDAHKPCQVGKYLGGLSRAVNAGLPISRIVNIREI